MEDPRAEHVQQNEIRVKTRKLTRSQEMGRKKHQTCGGNGGSGGGGGGGA
jgi:hypothetical protein